MIYTPGSACKQLVSAPSQIGLPLRSQASALHGIHSTPNFTVLVTLNDSYFFKGEGVLFLTATVVYIWLMLATPFASTFNHLFKCCIVNCLTNTENRF